jgi:glycosyltransferase involved in cell wall biosynthesis
MVDAFLKPNCEPKLSALVICQDSAATLARCLESLAFCDEIIVVDGGSHDQSVEIAKQFTDIVFSRPYVGTNDQKEFARQQAKGEWVLNLDSDEWATPLLEKEIREATKSTKTPGFQIPVRSVVGGRWLKHGGWYPNLQKRLYKTNFGFWDSSVEPHDCVRLAGSWGRLVTPIEHEPGKTLEDLERKALNYGECAGRRLFEQGRHIDPLSARVRPLWRYVRSYIFKGGFLDREWGHALARHAYLEGREKYRHWR